jgi:outer membrane lipoprotein SlyB
MVKASALIMPHRGGRVDEREHSPVCMPSIGNDGVFWLNRLSLPLTMLLMSGLALAGCGRNYSPDTYATNAVQQANKVDPGMVVGVRPVQISAQGTVGGVAGAAAGGVAGSQLGVGATGALGTIGGSIVGGVAGVAAEHMVADTNGFEYIVRKSNGDLVSVAQKDDKPLRIGQRVLVIAGSQARIVPDYTVPFDAPTKNAEKSTSQPQAPATEAPGSHPAAAPAEAGVPLTPPGLTPAPQEPPEAGVRPPAAPPVFVPSTGTTTTSSTTPPPSNQAKP